MYHFTEHALPYLYLENGYETSPEGTRVSRLNSHHGLTSTVAKALCTTGKRLTGPEITFLVSLSGIDEKDLAGMLDMTPQQFTAIATSADAYHGPQDILLRLLTYDAIFRPGQSFHAASFAGSLDKNRHKHTDGHTISRMQLKLNKMGWDIESITYA